MTINVGIYQYNEVEVLDFEGPFEVFSTASRVNARPSPESGNLFNEGRIVTATGIDMG